MSLFKQFVALAMLRIKPQDLPAHPMALQLSVMLALAVSMISLLANYSVAGAFARSLVALGLTAGFLYLMLQLQDRLARFNQAFTAICGSSIVIYLVALPLLPYLIPDADGNFDGLVVALVLLLDGWSLIVIAHIFQHTFDIAFGRGIAMALLLMFLTLLVFSLFPGPELPELLTGD